MYQINEWATGKTVATVQFDPYRYDMKQANKSGIRDILEGMKGRQQMNRTAGGDPEADGSTSLERKQSPSDDFILDRIAAVLNEGYAVVEVDEDTG